MEIRLMQVTVEDIAQMDRTKRGVPQYFARHADGRVFVWPDASGKLEELPVPVKLVRRTAEERAAYFEKIAHENLAQARDKIAELQKIHGDRRETVRVAFRRLGILGTGQILSEENMEEGLKALGRMDMAERLVEVLRPIYESNSCTHPPGCEFCNWCGYRAPKIKPKTITREQFYTAAKKADLVHGIKEYQAMMLLHELGVKVED